MPDDVTSGPVVVVMLADIAPAHRLWGWSRFVVGSRLLRNIPGLRFGKVMGSGHAGGFGLKPSASIQGLFCVFDSAADADTFMQADGPMQALRSRASEWFCCRLRAYSSRGSWAGAPLPVSVDSPAHGPVASLTRASIRPTRAAAFWRMQPPAERSLANAQGVHLAVGIGEAPLLRQATFTIWESVADMDRYARSGAHRDAIEAARSGAFFSESMFVRFVVEATQGSWKGRSLA